MKKTEKIAKKPNEQKKPLRGELRCKKRGKLPSSKGCKIQNVKKKGTKTVHSDGLRAFILAGVLVIFSASVSMAVIMIYSSKKNPPIGAVPDTELPLPITVEPEPVPVFVEPIEPMKTPPPVVEAPRPVISVSIQPPPQNQQAPVRHPAASPVRPPERPPANLGTLVFVIDDAGNNLRELESFLRIPGPMTIAVLPGLPHSAEAARKTRAAGKEVFLHQPMEALGAQDPGPGAIYSGMSANEIKAILKRNISEIGPVAGINNHQGSKITMDRKAMETILSFCAEQGLCFLDSRTTAETATPAAARRLGMKIGERDVFIDNEQSKDSMMRFLKSGLDTAGKKGSAVMIGHAWSPNLAALLAEQFPLLEKQGYSLKTASAIIRAER